MLETRIRKVFSDEDIERLIDKFESNTSTVPRVEYGNIKSATVYDLNFSREEFEEFNKQITHHHILTNYYIEYVTGSHAKLHKDGKSNANVMTTITGLSSDYEGGEMTVGDDKFKLKKGETVYFHGTSTEHGVDLLTSGFRLVYVAWFNLDEPNYYTYT